MNHLSLKRKIKFLTWYVVVSNLAILVVLLIPVLIDIKTFTHDTASKAERRTTDVFPTSSTGGNENRQAYVKNESLETDQSEKQPVNIVLFQFKWD